jgi:hypothetical protein
MRATWFLLARALGEQAALLSSGTYRRSMRRGRDGAGSKLVALTVRMIRANGRPRYGFNRPLNYPRTGVA